jgi:hypothetical protein
LRCWIVGGIAQRARLIASSLGLSTTSSSSGLHELNCSSPVGVFVPGMLGQLILCTGPANSPSFYKVSKLPRPFSGGSSWSFRKASLNSQKDSLKDNPMGIGHLKHLEVLQQLTQILTWGWETNTYTRIGIRPVWHTIYHHFPIDCGGGWPTSGKKASMAHHHPIISLRGLNVFLPPIMWIRFIIIY